MNPRTPPPLDGTRPVLNPLHARGNARVPEIDRVRAAAIWLQRLQSETACDPLIEEWIDWSSDPENLAALEGLNAIRVAAQTATFRSLLPKPNDPSVNGASRDGALSRAGVEALIKREYAGLQLAVTRRCGSGQLAADLLNEAICLTWSKWQAGRIEQPEQIAGYVYQVSLNLYRNHCRIVAERPERRADVTELMELTSDRATSEEIIRDELALQVKNVILGLPSQRDRAVLVRFYLDEESKETICRDLGLGLMQFTRILHRARDRLRKLIEARGLHASDFL